MYTRSVCLFGCTLLIAVAMTASVMAQAESTVAKSELPWMTDYGKAMLQAKAEGKMLLIAFCGDKTESFDACLEPEILQDPEVQKQMESFLLLKLPNDVRVTIEEKEVQLLGHATFREMCNRAGIAMVDFRDETAKHYGSVVSTFPVLRNKPYNKDQFLTMLGLPAGTLTQRTLVYAVRTHPEGPKSTEGTLSDYLTSEALASSDHQARIRLQGHHNWERRFHRISGRLPAGLQATEVCAESWPHEGLLVAAIDCVRCWHYSSGHWRQVKAYHRLWGYDMRRGSNGIWYATGIFSQQR
ncbi:MAG: hypothetical protein PVH19_05330 [Planctomycetia bacterium]|jgi:hypothetical protein